MKTRQKLKSIQKDKSDTPIKIDKISGSVMTIMPIRAPAYASICQEVHALIAIYVKARFIIFLIK